MAPWIESTDVQIRKLSQIASEPEKAKWGDHAILQRSRPSYHRHNSQSQKAQGINPEVSKGKAVSSSQKGDGALFGSWQCLLFIAFFDNVEIPQPRTEKGLHITENQRLNAYIHRVQRLNPERSQGRTGAFWRDENKKHRPFARTPFPMRPTITPAQSPCTSPYASREEKKKKDVEDIRALRLEA
jgi:hypothetical protein